MTCNLTKKQVDDIRNRPIDYPNAKTSKENDKTFFWWDGNKVHVDKDAFVQHRSYIYDHRPELIDEQYNQICDVLNYSQITMCPFCHVCDYVFVLAQDQEHLKCQCHEGHFKQIVSKNTAMSFDQVIDDKDEYERMKNIYRNTERDRHFVEYRPEPRYDVYILSDFYFKIMNDLGINRMTIDELNKIKDQVKNI